MLQEMDRVGWRWDDDTGRWIFNNLVFHGAMWKLMWTLRVGERLEESEFLGWDV